MWKASSFRSSPSKNPHTWRWPPRIAPARWIGCEALALIRIPTWFPAKMLDGSAAVFQKADRAFQEPIAGPASATMLAPVGGGGGAVQPLKRGRQVGLAAETGHERDLRDRLPRPAGPRPTRDVASTDIGGPNGPWPA